MSNLDEELRLFEEEVKALPPVTKETESVLKRKLQAPSPPEAPKPPPVKRSKPVSSSPVVVAGAEPTINREYLHSIVNSYRQTEDGMVATTSGIAQTAATSSGLVNYRSRNQPDEYHYDGVNNVQNGDTTGKEGVSSANKQRRYLREVGEKTWEDKSLAEWPENDYRIFVGNLGKEITSEGLSKPFKEYKTYNMCRVVHNKITKQSRGYGFVSFSDPHDMLRALREKQGKYLGHRPMFLKRSKWQERDIKNVRMRKKQDKKEKRIY